MNKIWILQMLSVSDNSWVDGRILYSLEDALKSVHDTRLALHSQEAFRLKNTVTETTIVI